MFKRKRASNRKVTKPRRRLYHMSRSLLDWTKLILILAFTVTGALTAYHFLATTTYFQLKSVTVHGELKHLSRDKVLSLASVPQDTNVFMVNIHQIGQNLKRHPWINDVGVRRNFPDGLIIEIKEHEAAALLVTDTLGEKGEAGNPVHYLISSEGVIFMRLPVSIATGNVNLPRLRGFLKERLEKFPAYYVHKFKEAFVFLDQFSELAKVEGFRLLEVDYNIVNGMTATVIATQGCEEQTCEPMALFFGRDQMDKKFDQWRSFADIMRREQKSYSKVDLHVLGKIYARELIRTGS